MIFEESRKICESHSAIVGYSGVVWIELAGMGIGWARIGWVGIGWDGMD